MTALDFTRRSSTPELMDIEECGFDDYRTVMAQLAHVNVLSMTHRPTLRFLDDLVDKGLAPADRPLGIVDVASGYGDMLREVDRWATRRGVAVDLAGVDLNPMAARAAAEATPSGRPIRWITDDVFEYRPDRPIDVITSAQFTHHLDDEQVKRFMLWMEATASTGWFISDLHRHKFSYHFFRIWTRVFGYHRLMQYDGPVSISRSFRPDEWHRLVDEAGLGAAGVTVHRHFPFRLCVGRLKTR